MSIVLLRGPKRPNGMFRDQCQIDRLLLVQLIIRTNRAGRRITVQNLGNEKALVTAIDGLRSPQVEAVLLDAAACVRDRRLARALVSCDLPYVEIRPSHLNDAQCCEPDRSGNCLGLVRGVQSHTYMLALSIALEHLTHSASASGTAMAS